MKVLSLFTVALCTAGILCAAETAKLVLPDVVAVVEGKEIKRANVESALDSLIRRSGKTAAEIPDDQKAAVIRKVVDDMISQQLAITRSAKVVIPDEAVEAQYQKLAAQFPDPKQLEEKLKGSNMTPELLKGQIRESMRTRKWIEDQVGGKIAVTDAEIKAAYENNPKSFDAPETVRASHILIKVPQDATPEVLAEKQKAIDAAAARISKGESFEAVAKEVSEDEGTKTRGGDLDFFSKAALTQAGASELADAAFALKKDEVSKPVKTRLGFHLVKKTDSKEARHVPLEEAKPQISAFLEQQKRQQAVAELLAGLRVGADVKNNLPAEAAPAASPTAKPEAKSEASPATKAPSKKKAKAKAE